MKFYWPYNASCTTRMAVLRLSQVGSTICLTDKEILDPNVYDILGQRMHSAVDDMIAYIKAQGPLEMEITH